MPTYTVHEPPPRQGEAVSAPERFVFVRDGFYFWAFALAPLWLLAHRLWLAFAIYLVVNGLLGAGFILIGAPPTLQVLVSLPIALLIGFEASAIWRWTLARRRWKTLGFVVGEDTEMAEQRFYAEWAKERTKRAGEVPAAPPAVPEPRYAMPVRRGAPSPNDVIGLFPEPGGSR
jgi:hypothetical protein